MSLKISQFIQIDQKLKQAVYLQVAEQLVYGIRQGYLKDGDQIPGSREIAKQLKIHRKTVVAGLEELKAQGWLLSVPSKGTFVVDLEQKSSRFISPFQQKASFCYHKSFLLDELGEQKKHALIFQAGEPDDRLIKRGELGRFYSAALKRTDKWSHWRFLNRKGPSFFEKQLVHYLKQHRQLQLEPEQILVTQKHQVLLYILGQLLIRPGDGVLVAEYGNPYANMVFQQNGARLYTLPLDSEGLQIGQIEEYLERYSIKFLYLQSRYAYPTTLSLSENRSNRLMQLARQKGLLLIEDDAYAEFSFERGSSSYFLKGTEDFPLIYLGKLGGFMPEGFRTNMMFGPTELIQEAKKYLALFAANEEIKQQAIGEMIYEGAMTRYARKATKLYQARRDYFDQLLQHYLGEELSYNLPKGGLAFWLQMHYPLNLSLLRTKAFEEELFLSRQCLFQNRKLMALRLGFGDLNQEEMTQAVKRLKKALERSRS